MSSPSGRIIAAIYIEGERLHHMVEYDTTVASERSNIFICPKCGNESARVTKFAVDHRSQKDPVKLEYKPESLRCRMCPNTNPTLASESRGTEGLVFTSLPVVLQYPDEYVWPYLDIYAALEIPNYNQTGIGEPA